MIGPFAWLQIPEKELEQMLSEYLDMMKDEKKCRTAQDTESLSGKQYEFQRDS